MCRSFGRGGGESPQICQDVYFVCDSRIGVYYYELWFGALGGNREKALLAHTTTQGCEICALGFLFSREHAGSDLMKTFGA